MACASCVLLPGFGPHFLFGGFGTLFQRRYPCCLGKEGPGGLHPKTIAEEQLTSGSMIMKPPPHLLWRTASTLTMATTGVLSRLFLYGTQRVEVDGMDTFLALLKSRRGERNAGLLTGWALQLVCGIFLG